MKVYPEITPELAEWIAAQPLFFNATAPLSKEGHINLSPRGLDSLRVIGPNEVVILDLTGSGNETAAQMTENGRITIMFCSFAGPPRILRLFGSGEVILPKNEKWQTLRAHFPADVPGVRQLFHVQVSRVQTSCGYGVPLMNFVAQRDDLLNWATKKGEEGILEYQEKNNTISIDGLPAPR